MNKKAYEIITTHTCPPKNWDDLISQAMQKAYNRTYDASCQKISHIPLLDIEYLNPSIDTTRPIPKHVLLSSKHATPFILENKSHFSQSSFFCIGHSSADFLTDIGLSVSHVFSTSDEFIKHTESNFTDMLYIRGQDVRADIKFHFEKCDAKLQELVTYKAYKSYGQADHLLDYKSDNTIILIIYSKRAAETLVEQISQNNDTVFCTRTKLLCMSQRVLNSMSHPCLKWKNARAARTPNFSSVMEELNSLLKI